jgi:hypothetical protein
VTRAAAPGRIMGVMAAFILIESVPFVALAFAVRRLGRWLTLALLLAVLAANEVVRFAIRLRSGATR